MALSRHQIREHLFKILFDLDFYESGEDGEQVSLYFDQVPDEEIADPPLFADDEERDYIRRKAALVRENTEQIDEKLNEAAKGWKTKRMAKADLTILRLALYEILFDEEIPSGVAINEAVELAKTYGSDASPAFVNGILARFAKEEAKDTNEQ